MPLLYFDWSEYEIVKAEMTAASFKVFHLDGKHIEDKASFLTTAQLCIPAGVGLEMHNWDAFSDTLYFGLIELGYNKVAILWTYADRLKRKDPKSYKVACECLDEVKKGVSTTDSGVPFAIDLQVILFENYNDSGL